jgi:uncharacterized protein (DUF58 family)
MIVPQNRLLFWSALVAVPFSILPAVYPQAMLVSVLLVGGLVVVAALDAVLAYGALDRVQVALPPVVRLTKDRSAALEVKLRDESGKARRLRVGLGFPTAIRTVEEERMVGLPAGTEWWRTEWPCTPNQRGSFRLRNVYLEQASSFGLWAVRRVAPAESELRVYPSLLSERASVAALFLRRATLGVHVQRQIGKGRDFEKLREYIPGDSYEEIHWKATARRGHPITKVFQIERTQELYVVLDASRLSARCAGPDSRFGVSGSFGGTLPDQLQGRDSHPATTALERFITAALVLGVAAEQQGDLFGLVTFSDQIGTFLRARNGREHYNACRDALYTLEPQIVAPDFDEIATFIRLRLRRRALLIFLTALDDPVLAESFVRNVDLLCRQHLLLVAMLKPAGAEPLFANADVSHIHDLYRHLGGHVQWHSLRELEKVLQRRGVRFALLENDQLSAQLISEYLNVKRRQLL